MKGKWLILISLALLLAGIKTGWVVYEGYKKGQEEYRDVRQKYFLTEAEFEPDAGQEGNKKEDAGHPLFLLPKFVSIWEEFQFPVEKAAEI